MPKSDKKQRHKTKREAKRQAERRRKAMSPIKRLAEAPGEIECWMSEGFDELGQAQIFVFKRAAGLSGIACFLIDRGVVGLKDAWTRMTIDRLELNEMFAVSHAQGLSMVRTGVEDVRRMVAGGVRWAHENGMRLPKDWVKPASLIGGVGDWMSADVSRFVKEFAGHPEDLRQRLIGEPLESYLQRGDIEFVFSEDAPYMDQKTGEYNDSSMPFEFDDDDESDGDDTNAISDEMADEAIDVMTKRLTPSAVALAEETGQWLKTRRDTPSPELVAAWQSIMFAAMMSKAAKPDASEVETADLGFDFLSELSGRIEESRLGEYERAVEQALAYLETDLLMMQNAMLKHGMADEKA